MDDQSVDLTGEGPAYDRAKDDEGYYEPESEPPEPAKERAAA